MKFWKMSGAGNDFIVINNIEEKIPVDQFGEMAKILCERRISIGADGFMVVDTSEIADYRMLFYNSDGSMGEMCGNGARCICRFSYENGIAGESQTIETTAGIVMGQRIDERNYKIRLNDPTLIQLDHDLTIDGTRYACSYVELGEPGSPHAVVPIAGLREYPEEELFELGRKIRSHESFPKGANVNFYEIIGEDQVYERTFERGVEGFTHACGTGTGSMVTVLTLQGKVSGNDVKVTVTGGQLIIDVDREGEQIRNLYLTGPAKVVARGDVGDWD